MSRYDKDYCINHDVDYFYNINGVIHHFASNGFPIPSNIDRDANYAVQTRIYERIEKLRNTTEEYKRVKEEGVWFNDSAVRAILTDIQGKCSSYDVHNFKAGFVEYAMVGCKSYDTIQEGVWHLITAPSKDFSPNDDDYKSIAAMLPSPEKDYSKNLFDGDYHSSNGNIE